METINLTLSRTTRSGRFDRAYLGGLTTESIVVKWDDGESLPEGTQLALYLGETLCASAETDETGTATLNTDTQELAEAFDGLPVDYALSFRLFLGDADTILAIVPAQVKKNWLDGGSHPPAPLPVYWTAEQTKAAIAEAVAKHNGEATAHADIRKAIDTHADRADNPHRVTAEQTGAVPLLAPGEHADPDTHGKTALVTQNGDEGGFAVSGQAGAGPDAETFVTKYQRESITAFGDGADFTKKVRYLIGPHNRNQPESILRVGDLDGTKPVTVTPETVAYRQKVTIALQIDRETLEHATANDAIDWVPSSKAVKAELDQKADAADVYTKAEVDGKVAVVYRFKGTVANKGALPSSGNTVGDVWDVSEDGMNYAWTGEEWDALGATVDLSAYSTTAQADARYLKLSGGTVTGTMRINGMLTLGSTLIVQNGESKFGSYRDTNVGVAYSVKASKGMFNEMAVDKLTGSTLQKYIPLIYRNTNAGTEVARVDQNGLKELHDGQLQYLADIYAPKAETYTKEEVDELIAQAVAAPTAQADTTIKWHAACSMLTVTSGATLTADTTGWTDGAQLFVRLVLPADYAGMADNIRLIGYAYFQPGEVYHCTAYKVGTMVYLTPIVREDTP